MSSRYHILWIDDEWELMTSFKKHCLLEYQMELHPFKTQKEGLDDYAKHPDFYEAVILDAKVLDESEQILTQEEIESGAWNEYTEEDVKADCEG